MTDENNEIQEVEAVVDYQAEVLQLKADMEKVLAKNSELLGEKKKIQASNKQMKVDDDLRAKKNGDFERLLESSEAERAKAFEELSMYKQEAHKQNIDAKAFKLTNELKAIPESAELLAHFVSAELNKLADEKGEVSETALSALKHQFMNDDKYKPLLLGNQSNGGGAVGAKSGAQKSNQMSRTDFENMSQPKRMEHIKSGGTLTD